MAGLLSGTTPGTSIKTTGQRIYPRLQNVHLQIKKHTRRGSHPTTPADGIPPFLLMASIRRAEVRSTPDCIRISISIHAGVNYTRGYGDPKQDKWQENCCHSDDGQGILQGGSKGHNEVGGMDVRVYRYEQR